MEVIKFEIKNVLKEENFLCNEKIEPIYFELAEYTLITLYKVYPFSSAYEGFPFYNPNEQFSQTVLVWADFFMEKKIVCKEKLTRAIQHIVDSGYCEPPSLPQVINAYHGRKDRFMQDEIINDYIDSIYNANQFEED